MIRHSKQGVVSLAAIVCALQLWSAVGAQDCSRDTPAPPPESASSERDGLSAVPLLPPDAKPFPINLPTALKLADGSALDIALASERVQVAAGQLAAANALWLPSLYIGSDYFRHDGQLQDIGGAVFGTSKQQFQFGVGPYAWLSFSDALVAPLAARQILQARQAGVQASVNDTFLAVAEAYFTVQEARGNLAGAQEVVRRTEDMLQRTKKFAPALVAGLEITRAQRELAHRQYTMYLAQQQWRVSSAELVRLLRLDPVVLVQPLEPPQLQVTLIDVTKRVDDLVAIGLTNRPELASQRALVEATLQLLRQEKLRPLVPSLLLRGSSTPVVGTLAAGVFGGGVNGGMGNFSMRQDWDVQLLWKLDNLGFGNRALIRQRTAENKSALLELFRTQDSVAADVVKAHAEAELAEARAQKAEQEVKMARENIEQNLIALANPIRKKDGGEVTLLVRPQEVVAAVQALGQAYADYFGAVGDKNRAQFRLYRALGRPARLLLEECHETLPEPRQATLGAPIPANTSVAGP
jgi:outer membrane protein TolC